jgi:hypothetical protein
MRFKSKVRSFTFDESVTVDGFEMKRMRAGEHQVSPARIVTLPNLDPFLTIRCGRSGFQQIRVGAYGASRARTSQLAWYRAMPMAKTSPSGLDGVAGVAAMPKHWEY